MFSDSEHEVWYGEVRLQPLCFQDGVMRASEGVLEAQVGNIYMETVAEMKLLSFNQTKSNYMVIGHKKSKKKILEELEEHPLTLCGQRMIQASEYCYLGTWLSEDGVSESAALSVRKRVGKVKHLIWEIKTVVEDCKNNIPGAFVTALRLWEGSVVPYLYYGAECWLDIPQATIKTLCQLEELFYLSVLALPKSTPKPGIYWQVGGKIPEARIMESKLNFYFHLVNLSNQSLAKLILMEEQKMETEGFFR